MSEEELLFADLVGEGFAGLCDWEVGVRVALTVLVLTGAFILRWVFGRAIRRRFGTQGASGGVASQRQPATTATAPTGFAR